MENLMEEYISSWISKSEFSKYRKEHIFFFKVPLFTIDSSSQLGVTLPPREIWQCLESFLVVTIWRWCYSWVEAIDTAKYPTIHRTANHTENYQVQNVNKAQANKPYCRKASFYFALLLNMKAISWEDVAKNN